VEGLHLLDRRHRRRHRASVSHEDLEVTHA
jgi:hypothetical protein